MVIFFFGEESYVSLVKILFCIVCVLLVGFDVINI